jgi:hypothetical protein
MEGGANMNGQEIKEYLIENYPNKPIKEIAGAVGLTLSKVYNLIYLLKMTEDITEQGYTRKNYGKISRTVVVDKSTILRAHKSGYNEGYRAGQKTRFTVPSKSMSNILIAFISLTSFVLGAVIGIIL